MTNYGQYVVPSVDDEVKFGVGQPSNEMLPLDIIKNAMTEIVNNNNDKDLLQYGDKGGFKECRKTVAEFVQKNTGQYATENDIFMTNGVTGAISLLCSIYKKSCKYVFVENPTYFIALNIFKEFGFEVIPIEMEKDGMNIKELKKTIDMLIKLDSSFCENDILIYTIPTFHNPTGITMSEKKRNELCQYATEMDITILSDEVYQLLYFDVEHKPPPSMFHIGTKYGTKVYTMSSFSKILAPSLRVGWIQCGYELYKILEDSAQLDSSGGINPFSYEIVMTCIKNGSQQKYLEYVRNELKERCDTICDALGTEFEYEKPNGGYFIWINFGKPASILLDYCKKVSFHVGSKFGKYLENYFRLSFSYYKREDLKTGVDRLIEAKKSIYL